MNSEAQKNMLLLMSSSVSEPSSIDEAAGVELVEGALLAL